MENQWRVEAVPKMWIGGGGCNTSYTARVVMVAGGISVEG